MSHRGLLADLVSESLAMNVDADWDDASIYTPYLSVLFRVVAEYKKENAALQTSRPSSTSTLTVLQLRPSSAWLDSPIMSVNVPTRSTSRLQVLLAT